MLSTPKTSAKSNSASATAPISSTETSVTPRQRPKACQLNPVNASQFGIGIGLPPSPSPRNILSSPIDAQHFKAPPTKTPENFNAQFEVDFTNIDNPQASQVAPALPTPNLPVQQKPQEAEKQFDNLFKSDLYPDPFGENDDEIVEIQTNYNDTQTRSHQLFEASVEQQQHVATKVHQHQHRRYMSDTSGFKRYEGQELSQTLCDLKSKYDFSTQSEVGPSGHSASIGDLISGNYKKDAAEAISTWNPFEDTTPFNQVVTEEEDLFGAEFDKIRQEGWCSMT